MVGVIQTPAQQLKRLRSEVKTFGGVPALYIDNELQVPFAYMSYLGEEKYYREVAEVGLHLYNIPAYLGDRGINSSSGIGPFRSAIWKGKGEYDLSSIKKDFDEILSADANAKVIIRIHLDPPVWWEEENPDEVSLLPNGKSLRTSFASMKWRHDAGEVLRSVVTRLLKSPYVAHLAGIHVAGGFTEEWFYHYKDFFYDESDVRVNEFRKWLRNKYNNNLDTLRLAWKANVNFSNAIPADISGVTREKEWRNTATDQRYFDTFDFQAGLMADHIEYFCKIVKEVSNSDLLTGAFYGYHYYVSDPSRGHGALARLLDCTFLDYLSSPNDYNRVAGEDWAPFAAIKSVQLHGKLWLAENDTRTSITTLLKDRAPKVQPPGDWYKNGVWIGPNDMETSVSFLWKNLGRMLAYGYGGWWFDMWGGWFSDPELLSVIRNGQEFYKRYLPTDNTVENELMKPEVAVIVDERIQFWDKSFGALTNKIIGNRYALGKTGIPYDLYLRTDLEKIKPEQYKVIWFMGVKEVTKGEKKKMDAFSDAGTLVMHTDGYGTGIYAENGPKKKFSEKVSWSAGELGEMWQQTGVHRYLDSEDVVYAGRGWISIHSLKGGSKTLKLPFYADIIDPLQQVAIANDVKSIAIDIKPRSTLLYRVVPNVNK